jgi:hypothetical protein
MSSPAVDTSALRSPASTRSCFREQGARRRRRQRAILLRQLRVDRSVTLPSSLLKSCGLGLAEDADALDLVEEEVALLEAADVVGAEWPPVRTARNASIPSFFLKFQAAC